MDKFRLFGVGLLELALSLLIIAMLLIIVIKSYKTASNNQKIAQAVEMYTAIRGAESNYLHSNGVAVSGENALAIFVGAGYLPTSYLDNNTYSSTATTAHSSPWKSPIIIASDHRTGQMKISMFVPDETICRQVVKKLSETVSAPQMGESVSTCTMGFQPVTVTYSLG